MATNKPPNLHKTQHTDFKVFVYRLDIGNKKDRFKYQKIDGGSRFPTLPSTLAERTPNDILGLDFSTQGYDEIVSEIEDLTPSQMNDFIEAFNIAISNRVDNEANFTDEVWKGNGFFKTIEITPLVASVKTNLDLYGSNSASIDCFDPMFTSFSEEEMNRWYENSPTALFGTDSNSNGEVSGGERVKLFRNLLQFEFKEFDMIRVMVYSKSEDSIKDRLSSLKGDESNFDSPIPDRLAWVPTFTGLVASVNRSAAAGSMPAMSANCLGLSRVFQQSILTFSKAIRDRVFDDEAPEIKKGNKTLNVMENQFSKLSPDKIFSKIMIDYLHAKPIEELFTNPKSSLSNQFKSATQVAGTKKKSNNKTVKRETIGVPWLNHFIYSSHDTILKRSVSSTSEKNKGTEKEVVTKAALVPFLPSVVLLHLVKTMFREPIYVFDDRIDETRSYMQSGGKNTASTSTQKSRFDLISLMDPYLDMTRQNFELYQSTYESPWNIFNTIKDATYMEIFEDRAGTFHFRFPRYNEATTRIFDRPEEIISTNFEKNDSAVFNIVSTNKMMNYVGAINEHKGKTFIDRASVLRYGIRMPHILQNPNAKSNSFMRELSRFHRDYTASREGRTGSINRIGDPLINIGEMAHYKIASVNKTVEFGGLKGDISTKATSLVGYITTISESIEVGGQYTQSIGLSFVRRSDDPMSERDHNENDSILVRKPLSEYTYTFSNESLDGRNKKGSLRAAAQSIIQESSAKVQSWALAETNSDHRDWLLGIPSEVEQRKRIQFPYVYDVADLVKYLTDPDVIDEVKKFNSQQSGDKNKDSKFLTATEAYNIVLANEAAIKQRRDHLGGWKLYSAVTTNFLERLNSAYLQSKSPNFKLASYFADSESKIDLIRKNLLLVSRENFKPIDEWIDLNNPASLPEVANYIYREFLAAKSDAFKRFPKSSYNNTTVEVEFTSSAGGRPINFSGSDQDSIYSAALVSYSTAPTFGGMLEFFSHRATSFSELELGVSGKEGFVSEFNKYFKPEKSHADFGRTEVFRAKKILGVFLKILKSVSLGTDEITRTDVNNNGPSLEKLLANLESNNRKLVDAVARRDQLAKTLAAASVLASRAAVAPSENAPSAQETPSEKLNGSKRSDGESSRDTKKTGN